MFIKPTEILIGRRISLIKSYTLLYFCVNFLGKEILLSMIFFNLKLNINTSWLNLMIKMDDIPGIWKYAETLIQIYDYSIIYRSRKGP